MKIVILSFFFVFIVSCASNQKLAPLNPIVLVHGSHFDRESWRLVQNGLEKSSQNVAAVNLPGRPIFKNVSLTEMAEAVCSKLSVPSIIVGHSQGGAVINQMVGICPKKIRKIIYVAAVVPLDGETAFEHLDHEDGQAYSNAVNYKEDQIQPKNRDTLLNIFEPSLQIKNLKISIYPEPSLPGTTKLIFKSTDFDSIPKFYVRTLSDQVIGQSSQIKFIKRTHFKIIYSLNSGHLPMLAQAQQLVQIILDISKENDHAF